MTWFRCLMVALIFFAQIHLRGQAIESGPGCLIAQKSCAYQSSKSLDLIKVGGADLRLSRGASLKFSDHGEMTLVRGHFSIDTAIGDAESADHRVAPAIKVQTLYGTFTVNEGEALVIVEDMTVNLYNLSGQVAYLPRGEKSATYYDLPLGFTVYFSGIATAGVAKTGFPRPAERDRLAKVWGKLYRSKEFSLLQDRWKDFSRTSEASTSFAENWYRNTYLTEVAKHREELRRLARLRAARKAENERWRNYFRERNFIGVFPEVEDVQESADAEPVAVEPTVKSGALPEKAIVSSEALHSPPLSSDPTRLPASDPDVAQEPTTGLNPEPVIEIRPGTVPEGKKPATSLDEL